MAAYIVVNDVRKSYPGAGKGQVLSVLGGISLEVEEGELVTFFGPNGCGKTTLLLVLAGLVPSDGGSVTVGGAMPKDVRFGLVFQDYVNSLFPWRTVLDNVAFPLEVCGLPKETSRTRAREALADLGAQFPENRYPYQLSGGQQQLVAIARGVASHPAVLLMDEPFGSLDFQTRISMHGVLLGLCGRTKMTTLFISHDIDEAIYLADRMFLLSKRPATIAGVIKPGLPKPRRKDDVLSQAFLDAKREALGQFSLELVR